MALAAAEQSQNQNTPDRQHNRQVPAIRRIGFVVSVLGRAEGTPSPGRSRIVNINAKALVRLKHEVVDSLIPRGAAGAQLLGEIPQHVRYGLFPAKRFVPPTEKTITLS